MINARIGPRAPKHWDFRLFCIAGGFMLLNTVFLWIRHYLDYQLSILWAAIPAITALSTSVLGIVKLCRRLSTSRPRLAKCGSGLAFVACVTLSLAALWLFAASLFGSGLPNPAPQGFLALVGIFMVATVCAFLTSASAFLLDNTLRKIGYLLLIPVVCWGTMLVVGIINGLEVGISLDFYANGVIAIAFLAIGYTLRTSHADTGNV